MAHHDSRKLWFPVVVLGVRVKTPKDTVPRVLGSPYLERRKGEIAMDIIIGMLIFMLLGIVIGLALVNSGREDKHNERMST